MIIKFLLKKHIKKIIKKDPVFCGQDCLIKYIPKRLIFNNLNKVLKEMNIICIVSHLYRVDCIYTSNVHFQELKNRRLN